MAPYVSMTPEQSDRLAAVERDVIHLAEDIREIKADVKSLVEWAATVRGGQKMALAISTLLGTLLGTIGAVFGGWLLKKLGLS